MASSPTGPGGPPVGSSNLGIAPNLGGLLCYAPCCIGLVFSVVVAVVEKQSRFLRFHAFQSLLLHGAALVVLLAIQVVGMILSTISGMLGFLISLLSGFVGLGLLGLTIFLMIKAYNNEEYELPTLGAMAKGWV